MRAIELAYDLYEDGGDLDYIIKKCLGDGVVFSDKELFFCGQFMSSEEIQKFTHKPLDNGAAFVVYIAAGKLAKAFHFIEADFLVFERRMDCKVRVINFDRARRLIWDRR